MAIQTNDNDQKITDNDQGLSKVDKSIQSGGLSNIILVIVLVGLAVFGTLFYFQKNWILKNTEIVEKQTEELNKEIDALKENKVEFSQNAMDALKKIEVDEIRWSDVIEEVANLMPKDSNGRDRITVLSYSGSGNGRITLNTVTQPSSLPPFDDVSNIISTFNKSVFFKNAFVPSISKGTNDDGSTTLSFMLNMEYQKADTGSLDLKLNENTKIPTTKVPVNK